MWTQWECLPLGLVSYNHLFKETAIEEMENIPPADFVVKENLCK